MPFGWIASKFGNKSRPNATSTREVPAAGRAVAASSTMKPTLYYFPVRGKYFSLKIVNDYNVAFTFHPLQR